MLYTVEETAKKLGISEQRVRKLLAQGRLKGKKAGKLWLVTSLSRIKGRKKNSL